MGPLTLMDLIGLDVNYTVTCSVFKAYYNDPRFRLSHIQKEIVDGGWSGRKSGRGFFDYADGAEKDSPDEEVQVSSSGKIVSIELGEDKVIEGVLFVRTDGRSANQRILTEGRPVILYDLALDYQNATV